MSTNLESAIVKVKENGVFYLFMESYNSNPFDWMMDADVYGPFASAESAEDYKDSEFANTGWGPDEIEASLTGEYASKIENARSPRRSSGNYNSFARIGRF